MDPYIKDWFDILVKSDLKRCVKNLAKWSNSDKRTPTSKG